MKLLPIASLLIALPAAFYLGQQIRPTPEPSPLSEPTPPAQNTPQTDKTETTLNAGDCILAIDEWLARSDSLTNQYPLYHAIARLEPKHFFLVAQHLLAIPSGQAREALHVLYLRWFSTDPQSLAYHYYVYRNQNAINWPFDTSKLIALLDPQKYPIFNNPNPTPATAATDKTQLIDQLRAAISEKSYLQGSAPFEAQIAALTRTDPSAIFELLDSIDDPSHKLRYTLTAISYLSETQPIEALNRFDTLYPEIRHSNRDDNYQSLSHLSKSLIDSHPDQLASWYTSHPNPLQADQILTQILKKARFNTSTQLDVILLLPPSPSRSDLLTQNISSTARNDWDNTLAWAKENLTGAEYQKNVSNLIQSGSSETIPQRIDLIERLPNLEAKQQAAQSLSRAWSYHNLDDSLAWALNIEDPSLRQAAIAGVTPPWAAKKPKEAWSFIESLPPSDFKNTLESHFAYSAAYSQTSETNLKNLEQFRGTAAYGPLINLTVADLAYSDPLLAISTLQKYANNDPALLKSGGSAIANLWIESDPKSAAQALWPIGGPITQSSFYSVIEALAQTDPSALLPLVQTIPDRELQNEALKIITHNNTLKRDAPEIIEQAQQLPPP